MSIQRFPAVNNNSGSSGGLQGTWNASTNTPALANTDTGKLSYMYQVSTGGTVDFGSGDIVFEAKDIVVNNGTVWDKIDGSDSVISVNGNNGVVVLDADDIGLGNVDNTSDVNKPISNATSSALSGKASTSHNHNASDINAGTLNASRLPTAIDATKIANGSVSNTEFQYLDGVTSAIQTQLGTKAPTANPTFTGTVSGVTKTHVGLPNVPNTDATNASNIGSGTLPDARLSTNIRRSIVGSFPVDDNIVPSCVVGLAEVAKTYTLSGVLTTAPSCTAKVVGLGAQSGQFTVRAEVTATDTVTVYYSYNDNSAGTIDIGEKTVYIENTKA